ncbi:MULTISPECIES: type II toxin-antitoxin system RelE/ParE family toxin [Leptolyngbya]|uniref:type II toxin-antitoxin system RelE/ParE family toxin n=1 Tax=Leptolyngbya TaxID=47251 RepID=UPI001682232D|nr:type II toxin-antitoxin system RelE/ParE family toxin [Leptolyngbya sp. FACHB-1624]MBD1854955.1 type II toxin-antitoxin system RelE/ParE family toxin [Leptolyngbya sp. FACHB-1624]
MTDKPIHWVGASREEIQSFPDEARKEAGFALRAIQQGEEPPDFKPISTVGKSVQEIRIRTEDAYRVFYVAKFKEAIYVLHAFQKKTQKTSQRNIKLGQQRYQQMLQHRQTSEELNHD